MDMLFVRMMSFGYNETLTFGNWECAMSNDPQISMENGLYIYIHEDEQRLCPELICVQPKAKYEC